MSQLFISTRGVANWRERLAHPDRQWRRKYSALETSVSWESAASDPCGLPQPIADLFSGAGYTTPVLLLAVAEHQVALDGGDAASQCDVWAIVKTSLGLLSLSVEAKAREPFGDHSLEEWLEAGETQQSRANRAARWSHVRSHLPDAPSFGQIRYQILHRCAAAVIEARRFGFTHAAFVVQAFGTPDKSFLHYKAFCDAIGVAAERDHMSTVQFGGLSLGVGWADCPLATVDQLAACV